MNYFKLLLLAVLLPSIASAQSIFRPGYVVNLKGDTLKGYIDVREWASTPTSIKFRTGPDAETKKFTINDITAFTITNYESYASFTGDITMHKADETFMLMERDTAMKTVTVFLKAELIGKNVNLYSYSDRIKTRYFITDKDTPKPQELIYRLYYDPGKVTLHKGRTVNENTYMKQLYELALKYDALDLKLQRIIEDARYDRSYIKNIVNKINAVKK